MTDLKGARVLVTGGQGFTGDHLRAKLEQAGCRVFSIVESGASTDEFVADLGDQAALLTVAEAVQPDYVIHLAAIANVAHSDDLAFYRVNVVGTTNLLTALVKSGAQPRKVLLASSANIYGNAEVSPVGETTPPAPLNHYAMSKVAMELMSRNWLNRLPLAFTRPFNYTGPGQSESLLIPKIVGHFSRREPEIRLGNLSVTREFNDVRFIADAYVGLLERAVPGEAYNLCSGQGYSLQQVLDLAQKLSGHRLAVNVDQALVRPNELLMLIGDSTKLDTAVPNLGKYNLERTLRWMLGL